MQTDQITEFLEQLLKEADLRNLPDDFRARYIDQLRELIQERVGILALEELHQEHVREFQTLLSGEDTDQQLHDFLTKNIPEFEQKLQDVLGEFREQFLDSVR